MEGERRRRKKKSRCGGREMRDIEDLVSLGLPGVVEDRGKNKIKGELEKGSGGREAERELPRISEGR